MSDTAVLEPLKSAGAKLVRAREEAIGFLQTQLKRGAEIKALRIRSGADLDNARAQKLEWTNVTTELLKELFDSAAVAEECNDWVGKIYPEYAEFGNFVEQFYGEMDHRIKRLKAVIRLVQKTPSETRASAAASSVPTSGQPQAVVVPAPSTVATPVKQSAASTAAAQRQQPETIRGMLLIFGGEESARTVVADFLDSLDVEVNVVDASSASNTSVSSITESLDKCRDASFALVLAGDPQQDRSFELGFCVGRLGLKRVCVVHSPGSQVSADPRGLAHVVLDLSGGWQLVLARHLKRAGLGVDLNRLC